jgi:hypothetical protein
MSSRLVRFLGAGIINFVPIYLLFLDGIIPVDRVLRRTDLGRER